ncbi:UvrD-helicase domain-containing protein [Variovorax sp. VNK109]|uniref:UvrD-helicase domain-containing protein n=1 Tax=Variovorax sp. VNK109 TaxID=3400919 RepID=UPI003C04610F
MTPAYEHNGRPVSREAFYAIACDPRRSVAVEACAGAGKTWMLVARIVRALLDGAKPHEILAITFTKKAAGEMRERLQEALLSHSGAPRDVLQAALVSWGMDAAEAPRFHEALSKLASSVLDCGRPVQVRTFHSWFAALLRNAPLAVLDELGLPASYELLEDDAEAVRHVWRRFYAALAAQPEYRADFEAVVATHGRSQTHKALQAALSRRVEFVLADGAQTLETSVAHFTGRFPQWAGLQEPGLALGGDIARARWLARASALGREANKTPQKAANEVVDALALEPGAECIAALRKAFFVKDEDRLTKNLVKFAAAQDAEAELQALCAAQAQHEAWTYHQRIVRLARILLAEFAQLKRERGWVDMNDVERAALRMLSDPVLGAWVQERLDARIAHLLVDEFQDTNPLQWQALHSWLSGYAGAGGHPPGVFIVGDPKQSIYRFRRAEPQVFVDACEFIVDGLGGDKLASDHTRRNAPGVIGAVNGAMLAAGQAGELPGFRAHTTESEEKGQTLRLPMTMRDGGAADDAGAPYDPLAWRDSLTTPRELPEETLRTRECRQAAQWIAQCVAAGTKPQDVMVLARKRDRLAVMQDELRALHVPAQQPDKTDLADVPEVQDVVALMDALVSPGHDLSLARALKSPLFGMGDDDLVRIARLRQKHPHRHWLQLLQDGELAGRFADAGRTLTRWQSWLQALPPHDALDAIYHDGDVLARFAAASPAALRLPVQANLRALLSAALQVDGARYATPYALVRAIRAGGIQAPVTAAPGAVRLLTIHGAKGLEADLVLLLDTDAPPPTAETMGVLANWPSQERAPQRMVFLASEKRPPACADELLSTEQQARQREELNALYVALTRARKTLVLSAAEPHRSSPGSWWKRLHDLCEPVAMEPAPGDGARGSPALAGGRAPSGETFTMPALPALDTTRVKMKDATDERGPADDDTGESLVGKALHRLLEWSGPDGFTPAQVRQAAREFELSPEQMHRAEGMARAIRSGGGSWAWNPDVIDWHGNEVALHHHGQVMRLDRLVRRRDTGHWWVLDFKSAARPQDDDIKLKQLRTYREAYRQALGPDGSQAVIRIAFMTGQGALVEIE